jgi:hypothetical protein
MPTHLVGMTNKPVNVTPGKQGFQTVERGAPADISLPEQPTVTTVELRVTDLREGSKIDLGDEVVTITSYDSDHKSVTIEFDNDEDTIASYALDETLDVVVQPQSEREFALLNTESGVQEHFTSLSASLALDPYVSEDEAVRLQSRYVREARARLTELRSPKPAAEVLNPATVPSMLPSTSEFANIQTEDQVRDLYEALTSPENISWDGERPPGEAQKAADLYRREAEQRLIELANWAKN